MGIERTAAGDFRVGLGSHERALLRTLPGQLRELLEQGDQADPSLRRLFPPAYVEAPEHEDEYQRLMGADLREHHLQAIALMESTIDADELSEGELVAWLSAVHDVRLVIGTRLDISEGVDTTSVAPDDPRAPGLLLFEYLTSLEGAMVDALASSLPD